MLRKILRNWPFLLIIALLLIPFAFLWGNWAKTENLSHFWTDPMNRDSFIINVASSIIMAIITAVMASVRTHINRVGRAVISGGNSLHQEKEQAKHEKIYLENLSARLAQDFPWETDKYTDLEALQQELEDQARTIRTNTARSSNRQIMYVHGQNAVRVKLQQFLKHTKQPIMLKGDPGSGKTLTVRRFIVDHIRTTLKNLSGNVKIPIYIPMEFYVAKNADGEPGSVYDFIYQYLKSEYPASDYLCENLSKYLLSGRLLIIFDGLNELPVTDYKERYAKLEEFVFRKYPQVKYVFTCRTLRYTSLSRFKTVSISSLDIEKTKRFIAAYQGLNIAEKIFKALSANPAMLRACQNPFMLQMLVRGVMKERIPINSRELFELYIQQKLDTSFAETAKIIKFLAKLAYTMQEKGNFAGEFDLEELRKTVHNPKFSAYLEKSQKAQLVDCTPDKKIRFYHQLLQEHFAATALQSEWLNGTDIEHLVRDINWQETIIICSGLVSEPETFVKKIWLPGVMQPHRLWLAMKCLGNISYGISDDYHQVILTGAQDYLKGKHGFSFSPTVLTIETLKALGQLESQAGFSMIGDTAHKRSGWVREVSIQVLGTSKEPFARETLKQLVISESSFSFLRLATPFFTTNELFALIMKTPLGFYWMSTSALNILVYIMRYLPYLWVFFALIIAGKLGVSIETFNGRFIGIILAWILMVESAMFFFKNSFQGIPIKTNLSRLYRNLMNKWVLLYILLITCWLLFPEVTSWLFTIVFLLLGIVSPILWILQVAYIIRDTLKQQKSLIYQFYKNEVFRTPIVIILIFVGSIVSLIFAIGIMQHINFNPTNFPPENILPEVVSLKTSYSIISVFFRDIFYVWLLPYLIWSLFGIWIYLITWIGLGIIRFYYWKYTKGARSLSTKILDIALSKSIWLQIREYAIKYTRFLELSDEEVDQLEAIIPNHPELKRELERTVYELRSQSLLKDSGY